MGLLIDLKGKRFGRLVVLNRNGKDKHNNSLWLCRCDCGKEKTITGSSLRMKLTVSCGCYGIEMLVSHRRTTHGLTGVKGSSQRRLFGIWMGIKDRCRNPKNARYSRYGGRGIDICEEWKNDYKLFYNWAIANGYLDSLTIDRIDNNGSYTPINCKWISRGENSIKKHTTIFLMIDGHEYSATKWASIVKKDLHGLLKFYKNNGYDDTVIYLKDLISDKKIEL